jgi:magnesium transporter
MQTTIQTRGEFTWIDILSPELESLKKILIENQINIKVAEELLNPSLRASTEFLKDCIYLSLHFPIKSGDIYKDVEIDFVIKDKLIITTHYTHIDFLAKFVSSIRDFNIETRGAGLTHGGAYLSYLITHMYKNILTDLDSVAKSTKDIEENIFKGDERASIESISQTRRILFNFESSLRFHKEVLESYCVSAVNLFGRDSVSYGERIMNDYFKLWNTIEHHKDMLLDLKDTNDFLISNKTNELIKSFTVLSFIVLPLTLLSGFFGMNTLFPRALVGDPYGTIYIAIFMLCISVFIITYLYVKKWL